MTTARRTRYFVVRFLYGAILLLLVWVNYADGPMSSLVAAGGEVTIQQMASFANNLFTTFVVVQGLMVLAITPTLVAGVIVEEKQRKTLNYLLSSQLTSSEIVLGKLAARLLHLGILVLVGLPVVSLLSLFGGVDPTFVMLAFAGTASTALLLAGLSIFVSTIAKRVREAVAVVYLLEIGWLAVPPILDQFVRWNAPGQMYAVFRSVNDWVLATHPFYVTSVMIGAGVSPLEPVLWMIGLQTAAGMVFILLAVWRLRPVFQRQDGEPATRGGLVGRLKQWRWRLLPRPACGADPMLWKELHVSRTSGLVKAIGLAVGLVLGGTLLFGVATMGWEAAKEVMVYGYGSAEWAGARENFNGYLRTAGALTYVLWVLAVAGTAASSFTSEREGDTWTSLLSTPLDPDEIVRAKMLGPVWSLRGLVGLIILVWTVGLVVGSVHPFGYVAAVVELVVFTWFAVALATFVSLSSKSTMRAQVITIGILLALNGGYLLCCVPLQPDTPAIMAGCTPVLEAVSLLSFGDVHQMFRIDGGAFRPGAYRDASHWSLACMFALFGYGTAAFLLTAGTLSQFESAANRPQIGSNPWPLRYDPGLAEKPAAAERDEV